MFISWGGKQNVKSIKSLQGLKTIVMQTSPSSGKTAPFNNVRWLNIQYLQIHTKISAFQGHFITEKQGTQKGTYFWK